MLLEDDYKTSYQDFDPESAESVISSSLLWAANYGSSLMFAAELDGAFRESPFRESGYTGIHQDIFYLLWATNMPSVLLELGFISNPSDYAYLSSASGQEKVAQRLFESFKVYKTNFDASMNVSSEPVDVQAPDNVHYGIQIMAGDKQLKASDSSFKGFKAHSVKVGKIYKYIIGKHSSKAEAQKELSNVKKSFPDAFIVKVAGNVVSRP
jgi:N-acetylmuramoyl-L-alanine amidase